MTAPPDIVDQVRRRANFACEYCGVTETDTGGRLSVDHLKPRAHGGADALDNLLYCCHRCNLYKADFWTPRNSSALPPFQQFTKPLGLLLAQPANHLLGRQHAQ